MVESIHDLFTLRIIIADPFFYRYLQFDTKTVFFVTKKQ